MERRLVVPTSEFFRGIINFYDLQLVHLNPNGILHIAIFMHLREAYLGIQPHFHLFRKLFHWKPQPSQDKMAVLGGAGFQLRDSDLYLEYEILASHGAWREKWFYIENHDPPIPVITGYRPKYSSKWLEESSIEDSDQVVELL